MNFQPSLINKFAIFLRIAVLLLFVFFTENVDCLAHERAVHGAFLSDRDAKIFWKNFLFDRFADDYVALIRVVRCSDDTFHDGIILHKNGQFIVEFWDQSCRFLISADKVWSNIKDNETFISDIPYGPNELLLPVICVDLPEYCGPKKVCGRMTQRFVTEIPEKYRSKDARFVRFSVDGAFRQPLQIEYLDKNKKVIRYQRVESLKKHGSEWMPKGFEFFDVRIRSRFKVNILKLKTGSPLDEKFFSEKFLKNHSFKY